MLQTGEGQAVYGGAMLAGRRIDPSIWNWRFALVLLALLVRLMVPPGFMPAAAGSGAFPLVICSAHAPTTQREPRPAPQPMHKPCVFAGHGLGLPLALDPPSAEAAVAPTAVEPQRLVDLRPGRGLAAPPPPPRGPPSAI